MDAGQMVKTGLHRFAGGICVSNTTGLFDPAELDDFWAQIISQNHDEAGVGDKRRLVWYFPQEFFDAYPIRSKTSWNFACLSPRRHEVLYADRCTAGVQRFNGSNVVFYCYTQTKHLGECRYYFCLPDRS